MVGLHHRLQCGLCSFLDLAHPAIVAGPADYAQRYSVSSSLRLLVSNDVWGACDGIFDQSSCVTAYRAVIGCCPSRPYVLLCNTRAPTENAAALKLGSHAGTLACKRKPRQPKPAGRCRYSQQLTRSLHSSLPTAVAFIVVDGTLGLIVPYLGRVRIIGSFSPPGSEIGQPGPMVSCLKRRAMGATSERSDLSAISHLFCRSGPPVANGLGPYPCDECNPPSSKAASFPPIFHRMFAQCDAGASLPVLHHQPNR